MPKAKFTRGQSVFLCHICGRSTRDTGDNGQCELCPQCYEIAGWDNQFNDDVRLPTADEATSLACLLDTIRKLGGNAERVKEHNEYAFPSTGRKALIGRTGTLSATAARILKVDAPPDNVLAYFELLLGSWEFNSEQRSAFAACPIASSCGRDCAAAILAGASLMHFVTQATGPNSHPERGAAVKRVVADTITMFMFGSCSIRR
jgi:hypothetical protein